MRRKQETLRRNVGEAVGDAWRDSEKQKNKNRKGKRGTEVATVRSNDHLAHDDIAVIGMACRFPGANDYQEYWHLLINGINAIKEIPASRWDVGEYYSPDIDEPNKSISKWCGLVDDIDKFDNRFFNISPREAKNMDPQQRLLLEETWHCIEDSGVPIARLREKKTSVYIGVMSLDYLSETSERAQTDSYACLGNYECILANRLSYYFGLSGASLSIDAACASSLIALHEAKTSLRHGESDYAIAGGASLNFHPFKYISFSKSRMLSPDGQCRTFSADANGYVPGDGVGVLLLQRLSDALRDGNHVYGVIKGSAINHTGQSLSITAPRTEAQRDVILGAYRDAGVSPESVSYVEAHGTGTSLGDPIEVESLTRAFREHTEKKRYCGIGSVKSNIGHLEAAAGVAGVIKLLLMFQHRKIPRTLNITKLNPIIDFDQTPFVVALESSEWKPVSGTDVLRAGVSSFGFGGANAHMLLEEYVVPSEKEHRALDQCGELFQISSRTEHGVTALINEWKSFVRGDVFEQNSVRDICLTSIVGRESFAYRAGTIVHSKKDLFDYIESLNAGEQVRLHKPLCIGIGNISLSGYKEVQDLYEENSLFRSRIDELLCLVKTKSLVAEFRHQVWQKKQRPLYTFIAYYAFILAGMDLGLKPALIIPRGSGTLLALVVSGVLKVEEVLQYLRGKKNIRKLELRRPRIPLYDTSIGQVMKPYQVEGAYLRELLTRLSMREPNVACETLVRVISRASGEIPEYTIAQLGDLLLQRGVITHSNLESALVDQRDGGKLLGTVLVEKGYCTFQQIEETLNQQEALRRYVDKARLLQERQFTFTKYLAEWDEVLQKWGKSVAGFLGDETLLQSAGEERVRERLLLRIIILNSLRKLNRKWNLSDQALLLEPSLNELLDLLMDGVLTEEQVSELLLDEEPDYEACAAFADERQDRLSPDFPYPFLKSHHTFFPAIENKTAWVETLQDAVFPSIDDKEFVSLIIDDDERPAAVNVRIQDGDTLGYQFKRASMELWCHGLDLTWSKLYPEGSYEKVSLPTYVFQKGSFWVGSSVGSEERTKEAQDVAVKLKTGMRQDNERALFARTFLVDEGVVYDHVITGKHLIPAASMLDLAFEAGSRLLDRSTDLLRNVSFLQPGVVETALSVEVDVDASKGNFSINADGSCLSRGKYEQSSFQPLPSVHLPSLMKGRKVPVASIYNALLTSGYQYGEGLRVVKAVWRAGKVYMFELSDADVSYAGRYNHINARLLDGIFQSVLATAYLERGMASPNALHIPYFIEGLASDGLVHKSIFVVVNADNLADKGGDLLASFGAYDESGHCVARVDSMVFKRVNSRFLYEGDRDQKHPRDAEALYYKPVWEPSPIWALHTDAQEGARNALVFGDEGTLSKAVLKEAGGGYGDVKYVLHGEAFERRGEKFIFNPEDGEAYKQLMREVLGGAGEDDPSLDIYYLWSSREEPERSDQRWKQCSQTLKPVFHLLKALTGFSKRGHVHIVACTRDAQIILAEDVGGSFSSAALAGFLKNGTLEVPRLSARLIDLSRDDRRDIETAQALLFESGVRSGFELIGYRAGKRFVRSLESVDLPSSLHATPWREGGTYILAGGAGGLGIQIARAIAAVVNARIALIGRSEPNAERFAAIKAIETMGSDVAYYRADITDAEALDVAIHQIKERWGAIHGVIQASGVINDCFFANKDWESFQRVMVPKVEGTVLLNEALKDEPLDFFVVFSSIVSLLGNIGQADYAAANSFLDAFIQHRAKIEAAGKNIAINWTLWSNGGMGIDDRTRSHFQKTSGIIDGSKGLAALRSILSGTETQVVVADRALPNLFVGTSHAKASEGAPRKKESASGSAIGHDTVQDALKSILSEILHVARGDLDNNTDLKEYGLDSVALTEFSDRMSDAFDVDFNPSVLFEHTTLDALSRYVSSKCPTAGSDGTETEDEYAVEEASEAFEPGEAFAAPDERLLDMEGMVSSVQSSLDDIAVVGMAGIFPGAPDVEAFWKNIAGGKDAIVEIPSDRFDWKEYYGDPTSDESRMNCKWGGFINDVDKFDASFFNISPREAELMDPQQRLMLEVSWRAIEDAGYAAGQLSDSRTGVFVGVCNYDYGELLDEQYGEFEAYTSTGNYLTIIPNRISFFLNLHGPSMAIDAACSSSLIAVHQAVTALQRGECETAIAGGVNVLLTPKRFVSFSKAGMLSPDGRCKTFDRSANGYVRGEGAGAIILKPLARARADGDHIYGVIKGSAENHGGRANSLTAPNPVAQAELLEEAYERAGIEPWRIGYIECHGTGTSLGDPVEINGLKKAFDDMYRKYGTAFSGAAYCALGAVKSNVGHLESAAGVAGIIKALCLLKHRMIPGVVHFRELNPYIDIDGTPFFIPRDARAWDARKDHEGHALPRVVGVSSFGFGGANAHVVIEEDLVQPVRAEGSVAETGSPEVVLLSAKSGSRLRESVKNLLEYIEERRTSQIAQPEKHVELLEMRRMVAVLLGVQPDEIDDDESLLEYGFDEVKLALLASKIAEHYNVDLMADAIRATSTITELAGMLPGGKTSGDKQEAAAERQPLELSDIAYTLQVGREPMEERLAVVAGSLEDLTEKLRRYLDGAQDIGGLHLGNTKSIKDRDSVIGRSSEEREFIHLLFERRNLNKLAALWAIGSDVDWTELYAGYDKKPRRLSLPGYPFAKERFWVPAGEGLQTLDKALSVVRLHDLLDSNESTLEEQTYRKTLTGDEYFLRDHVVEGEKVLPGVVYLEMARLAGDLASRTLKVRRMRDVVWLHPVKCGNGKTDISVRLLPRDDHVFYEVDSGGADAEPRVLHAQGKIEYADLLEPVEEEREDIERLRARCPIVKSRPEYYEMLRNAGLAYGPSFQAIRELRLGEKEAFAELVLPDELRSNFKSYVLHPSVLDGALQAVVGLAGDEGAETYVPFSVGSLEILKRLKDHCFVFVRALDVPAKGMRRYNVDVLDRKGRVLVKLRDFVLRRYSTEIAEIAHREEQTTYFRDAWVEMPLSQKPEMPAGTFLLMGGDDHLRDALQRMLGERGRVLLVQYGDGYKRLDKVSFAIKRADQHDCKKLIDTLREEEKFPDSIIHIWDELAADCLKLEPDVRFEQTIFSVFELSRVLMQQRPKQDMHVLFARYGNDVDPYVEGLSGFGRTLHLENSKFSCRLVSVLQDVENETFAGCLFDELAHWDTAVDEVLYRDDVRYGRRVQELPIAREENVPVKEHGVYIMTGGMGGLGLLFAKHLLQHYKANIVLCDLRQLTAKDEAVIGELELLGGSARYIRCDVTKVEDVKRLVRKTKKAFGRIDGIIHAAGLIRDSLILKKQRDEMALVLKAKILGAVNFDAATAGEDMDFFVLFSSITGTMGNVGQCDYAYANRFLDKFSAWRGDRCKVGDRHGRTLSIAWPLWESGGMAVSDEAKQWLRQTLGMEVLPTNEGLQAFENLLGTGANQALVAHGDTVLMRRLLGVSEKSAFAEKRVEPKKQAPSADMHEALSRVLHQDVVKIVAGIVKVQEADLDADAEMSEYGFDSITITEFTNKVNAKYGTGLTPAVFFEHASITSMVQYLLDEYASILSEFYHLQASVEKKSPKVLERSDGSYAVPGAQRRFLKSIPIVQKEQGPLEAIAVVGMGGAFPGSQNLELFWEHLEHCDDLIAEVPSDRWDWREYYGDPRSEDNRTLSKWGGFMDDVNAFDATFFGISPHEAKLMDPQQRLFLETVWKTIEHAGYAPSSLSGSRMGLFVGVSTHNYCELLQQAGAIGAAHASTGTMHSVLANRISYLLNFHGPSEPIDTACSSSLIAIHRAVRSIQDGDCEMAIAGGVGLILTPTLHISFGSAGMLSPDGRCKSFDKSANGYVRGEGVGAVLLKPLSKALHDGDHIYGVIRATAENHGGHVSSLTVPNPVAQAELLVDAYTRAGIEPWRVGFVECHGTGTSLGDPVEINGLKRAFSELYRKSGKEFQGEAHCGLGTVKTNIGHLEAAAGIAGFLKVLLGMQHRKLPGVVHFQELNPYIDIEGSPFYIVNQTRPWERQSDAFGRELPLVAGISSFGFGGANAHVVVEEFRSGEDVQGVELHSEEHPNIFVLSARTREQLKRYAATLADVLKAAEENESERFDMRDLAYTLQVGRDAMSERLALVASSIGDLKDRLNRFVADETAIDGVHVGSTKGVEDREGVIGKGDDDLQYIQSLFLHGNLNKLAGLWVNGSEIDWSALYEGETSRRKRLPLPTYPFKQDRYWIPEGQPNVSVKASSVGLHELVDINESTLSESRYRKVLNGTEYYLRDHVVGSENVLPGVAYLEMARAAGEFAADNFKVRRIKDVMWLQPVQYSGAKVELYVSLYPGDRFVDYEVASGVGNGSERIINARGKLEYGNPSDASAQRVDVEALRSRCTKKKDKKTVYQLSDSMGLHYGPSFQAISELVYNDSEVLAQLRLPEPLRAASESYILHPSLMDGALQATLSLVETSDEGKIFVPFCMREVEIIRPLGSKCFAYARSADSNDGAPRKFDIDLLDETGSPLVSIRGFVVREFSSEVLRSVPKSRHPDYFNEVWLEAPLASKRGSVASLLIFGIQEDQLSEMKSHFGEAVQLVEVRYGEEYKKMEGGVYEVKAGRKDDCRRLIGELSEEGIHPDHVVFLFGEDHFAGKDSIDGALNASIYSVFEVTKALMAVKSGDSVKTLCVYHGEGVNPYVAALSGFGRSAHLENSKFSFRVMSAGCKFAHERLAGIILDEFGNWDVKDVEIQYESEKRYRKVLDRAEIHDADSAQSVLKQGGVYLITGGAGGLGAVFARHLASTHQAKLVLSDLRELDARGEDLLREIEQAGGEVIFVRCDVTNSEQVHGLVKETRERFGRIDGVIHAAGAIRDSFIVKKERAEMDIVLGAKIRGVMNLDEATADVDLDFFIMFASIAGVMGNVGQCDYAYANRFLDAFCEWREGMRSRGERRGKTLSFDWPLWAEGGMMVDDEVKKRLKDKFGLNLLKTQNGIEAFNAWLPLRSGNIVVLDGDVQKIMNFLGVRTSEDVEIREAVPVKDVSGEEPAAHDLELAERVEGDLIDVCVELLDVQPENLDPEIDFGEFGVDSIMMIKMMNIIESRYGKTVDPNSIAMHPTIRSFAQYLIDEGIASSSKSVSKKVVEVPVESIQVVEEPAAPVEIKRNRYFKRRTPVSVDTSHRIAIVGMACRFPGAPSVETFWYHLREKDELIVEVPRERWNAEDYFSVDRNIPGKSYSKWGGFIEGVDAFDATYFGISDDDAITMDPQQRIMLELTQELLDRSGYTKDELSGSKTSVFIGAASNQYIHNHLDQLTNGGLKHMVVGNIPNMIAARISDYYNLRGPSQTIDTACSSSLVALSEACQSLRSGESETAIVGGVMLLVDPYFHIGFGKAEVLSPNGKSYVFDERANGFVLGEGAGLVLLKPYEKAVEEGDQILGVILGSAVNNDGHTMGVTVPNQEGQKEVIEMAIKDSGIDPGTITYLEAHGTGTLLGDPIEIKAASEVYSKFTKELQFCAVGSVKSNIGHLLTAAGVASLIKVLLSLQHGELLPTLNCEKPHPRFRFSETPFYPNLESRAWQPSSGVRRAAISSFGFGGTNCHVIMEEFRADDSSSYLRKREPLPLTHFRRKRYWIGSAIEDIVPSYGLMSEMAYRELFEKIRQGKVTPDEATRIR